MFIKPRCKNKVSISWPHFGVDWVIFSIGFSLLLELKDDEVLIYIHFLNENWRINTCFEGRGDVFWQNNSIKSDASKVIFNCDKKCSFNLLVEPADLDD